MGVNCRITLPAGVRVDDVADVMGALAGFPCEKHHFSPPSRGWSAGRSRETECVRVEGSSMPEACYIHLKRQAGKLVDGETHHYAMYHFEFGRNGERGLCPPSTDFWIAMGRGLVDFFGGSLDFSDCDDTDVDYEQPARPDINAEDGDEWYSLQNRKLAVQPLTEADLKAAREVAAYKR